MCAALYSGSLGGVHASCLHQATSGTDRVGMAGRLLRLSVTVAVAGACAGPASPSGGGGAVAILAGAGDIGWCGSPGPGDTGRLLDSIGGTVFTAGDNAYPSGTADDFQNCYDPGWGRHRPRTRPSAGNHDYASPGAAPYFAYFGDSAGPAGVGYYSYGLGLWHIVVLNSNVSMAAGSPQDQWLRDDLLANPTVCTLAYWHHPLFSSSLHGNDPRSYDAWQTLRAAGVDVVVNGHDHVYERFVAQTPDGIPDSLGIRQFTVGTGGAPLYTFGAALANSELRYNDQFGVLKLTLRSDRYDWEFITTQRTTADAGNAPCRR
jgi:hypothetical protein